MESKFSDLLKPIKDLADNWSIDIACELEAYLEDLEEIRIKFSDDENSSLNFAEAALVIQGSACIYSRKVEMLYRLVFETLEKISERQRAKIRTSINKEGEDADAPTVEEEQFLVLDHLLEDVPDTEISMSRDALDEAKARYTTPFAKPSSNEGNFHVYRVNKTPMAALSRRQASSVYALGSGIVHQSGALLLDDSGIQMDEEVLFGREIGMPTPALGEVPMTILRTAVRTAARPSVVASISAEQQHESIVQDDAMEMDMPPLQFDAVSSDDDGGGGGFDDGGSESEEEEEKGVGWMLLDPHSVADSALKAIRPGKPFLVSAVKECPLSEEYLEVDTPDSVVGELQFSGNLAVGCCPEFQALLASMEKSRCRRCRPKSSKASGTGVGSRARSVAMPGTPRPLLWGKLSSVGVNNASLAPWDDDEDDDGNVYDFGEPDDDDFPMMSPTSPLIAPLLPNADDYAMPDMELDLPEIGGASLLSPDAQAIEADSISYEELYAQQIAKYMKAAEQFRVETDMSRTVSKWRHRIEKALELEKNRSPFDIRVYGMDILESEQLPLKDEEEETPQFSSLMEGKPCHEICRYFAAVLQLACSGNVLLEAAEEEDDFKVTALSKELRFQVDEGYRAPSAGKEASEPPPKKRRKSKKKK